MGIIFQENTRINKQMKFSIITPVYNGEEYLSETIESVLSQEGDFEIEYIIQDGGSTDKTVEILKSYEERLRTKTYPTKCSSVTLQWRSEKDNGMYDAINKGFSKATGEIFAYINADDIYLPGAFAAIQKTIFTFPDIEWIKGITSFIKESGKIYQHGRCFIYNKKWIERGIYGRDAFFIQQDSVFWTKKLWLKTNGINPQYKLAGDYYLWIQFAKHAHLWSLNKEVSCFRKRAGQLSSDMARYRKEQGDIIHDSGPLLFFIKLFFLLRSKSPSWLGFVYDLIYSLAFKNENPYGISIDSNGIPQKYRVATYTLK